MSKVQLAGNANGTGIFTIASPNSNTDRTLTLPDNTGTLLSSASTVATSQLPPQLSVSSSAPSNSLLMDAVGRIRMSNQPGFVAVGAGYNGQYFKNQPIGNYSPSAVGFNVGSNFSYRASGGTARFTAPVSGYYYFAAGGLWYGGVSLTAPRTIAFQVNSGTYLTNYADSGIPPNSPTLTAVLYLNANDYIEAYLTGTQDGWYGNGATAGAYDGSAYNYFCGYLLG